MPLSRLQTCICHICKYVFCHICKHVFVIFGNMFAQEEDIKGWVECKAEQLGAQMQPRWLSLVPQSAPLYYSANVPSLVALSTLEFETKNTIGANVASLIVSCPTIGADVHCDLEKEHLSLRLRAHWSYLLLFETENYACMLCSLHLPGEETSPVQILQLFIVVRAQLVQMQPLWLSLVPQSAPLH